MSCRQAPWQVRAASFASVADAFGACMATRYRLYPEDLWRRAAAVWPVVVAVGLPAVRCQEQGSLCGDQSLTELTPLLVRRQSYNVMSMSHVHCKRFP